jgi:hypothetical protein
MATPPKGDDLRVRRTHQQLQRAFIELLLMINEGVAHLASDALTA